MMKLIDTNILVYAHNVDSPFYSKAKQLVDEAIEEEFPACYSTQNLMEFYSIITNSKRVERPLDQSSAVEVVTLYLQIGEIKLLSPSLDAYRRAIQLAEEYSISKAEIFDALLVATMEENGIEEILTANEGHFNNFSFIKITNPFS